METTTDAQRELKTQFHDTLTELAHQSQTHYAENDHRNAREYHAAATAMALMVTSLWQPLRDDFAAFLTSGSTRSMHDFVIRWLWYDLEGIRLTPDLF